MLCQMIPQLIIFYANDGQEMDQYLSEEMAQIIEYPLSIYHKRIEDIGFDFENICENTLKSNAVIMILSKEFLHTIIILSRNMYRLTRLLRPSKTILMFFGCRESDLSPVHRSLFYGYRGCNRVVATQAVVKQFVINTIKVLQNILDLNDFNRIFMKRRNRFSNTPQFELSVDRVYHQANQKIFILLDKAISDSQRIHLSVGVSNDILIVHWKNPYTLFFTLPEFMISYNKNLEISLICSNKHLGTRSIECLKSVQTDTKISQKDNTDKYDDCSESLMSSLSTVSTDDMLAPEIPLKTRKRCNTGLQPRTVYLNDQDFYVIPDTEHIKDKTEKIRQMLKTGSLDRRSKDFERKYSIYDIPRSLSLTRLDSSERQVFV